MYLSNVSGTVSVSAVNIRIRNLGAVDTNIVVLYVNDK